MNEQDLQETLTTLHQHNQLESTFDKALEARLWAAHPQNARKNPFRVYRRLIAAGIAVTLLAFMFTAIPTFRVFAEEVLNFFKPAETNVVGMYDTEPPMYLYDYRPMLSLERADEVAAFPFLVLLDTPTTGLVHLFADQEAILLAYQTGPAAVDQIPPMIAIRQLHTPTERLRPMIVPGMNSTYEEVTIRGTQAVYAKAGWSLQMPYYSDGRVGTRYQSLGHQAHRLAWWEGDVAVVLTVSETLTDDMADVIAIAESLLLYTTP